MVPVKLYGAILNGGNGESDAVTRLVMVDGLSADLDVRAGRQLAGRDILQQVHIALAEGIFGRSRIVTMAPTPCPSSAASRRGTACRLRAFG
jgi:hypothetical protein